MPNQLTKNFGFSAASFAPRSIDRVMGMMLLDEVKKGAEAREDQASDYIRNGAFTQESDPVTGKTVYDYVGENGLMEVANTLMERDMLLKGELRNASLWDQMKSAAEANGKGDLVDMIDASQNLLAKPQDSRVNTYRSTGTPGLTN